ncbi:hypothetical protein [Dyadobacter psychrophilus]|uniref:Uncharacterized protein n=1 Tax=Dyadobacter psychrophilus TaxID=651661 RepID=A0A1T5DXS2_9BACT|nr:hypothetical protein [Dyadobacter psychrophilus]SKB76658.1 hypothetical protein SAMN05660293_01992 [Dyadobacter psychrophilus]
MKGAAMVYLFNVRILIELDDLNSLIQDCGSGWRLLLHPDFLYGHALN